MKWPRRSRSWLHFWKNRPYVRLNWRHWLTSPDLRNQEEDEREKQRTAAEKTWHAIFRHGLR